jgi:PAS domain S-box-containing protein
MRDLRQKMENEHPVFDNLDQSEATYRNLIERLPDATFVHVGLEIVLLNPATLRLFGASQPEQLLGRSFLDFIPVEQREAIRARIERAAPEDNAWFPHELMRLDGTSLEVEAAWIPLRLADRSAMQTVLRDITKRRRLETQLRQAQKVEAIGTLAGGIAHDFNNILGAIFAFTEIAKLDAAGNSGILESLNEVLRAAERAKELVAQILTFSRQQPLEKRVLQLGLIVKEALQLLRSTLPSTIKISLHADPRTPAVFADPGSVHQILMNLCTNAAHAIGSRQGRLQLRLEPVTAVSDTRVNGQPLPEGLYARLTVADSGQGMTSETLERIFDPFFTTKSSGEGTGLGLAVVHGILREHDGVIHVESQPGGGSEFTLFFPATDPKQIAAAAPPVEPPAGNGQHVLVVDDEPALARVTVRMLQRLGYQAAAETDPTRALARFRDNPREFDLLLSDLTMPGTSGFELAMAVLKLRPSLPILLCTGFSPSLEREALQKLGICDILYKPISPSMLAQALHGALNRLAPQQSIPVHADT